VTAAAQTEPEPRPGEFIIFVSFLERGLSLSTSKFLRQFLSFYNTKISDLGPHNIQQIFRGALPVLPVLSSLVPLWHSIFHSRATHVSKSDQTLATARGITF
jgi:hypothetical protein